MNQNRKHGGRTLPLAMAMAAVLVTLIGIRGADATIDTNRSTGWDQVSAAWGSVGSGSEVSTASSPSLAVENSLLARKGRKGGVKFEHGRPGHASANSDEAIYAKGRKGGVKFEHGRPGHASASGDETLFARKGRKGGVKFEHGRPGHASEAAEAAVYARKGRPKPERRG